MKIFKNGLVTGLILQFAIGPVFFFIINLSIQKSFLDGLVAVLAVTAVDYFYITLAILGVGKLLENKKTKKILGIVGSIALIIFGIIMIKGFSGGDILTTTNVNPINLLGSFLSVFLLTISNPLTIIFFTNIFMVKALEYNYTKRELLIFGFGAGFATLLFMGISVILFSLVMKGDIPISMIKILNLIVGFLLIVYGGVRFLKVYKEKF